MTPTAPARRTGGRSARVRAAVHRAFTELLTERGYGNFAVGDVAERAGVADSSVYRRWGRLDALLMDVLVDRLNTDWPVPDTGGLAGDLREFALNVARGVNGPDALTVLRTVIALLDVEGGEEVRRLFLSQRTGQIEAMLDRARARGERTPEVGDVVDVVMAPMYFRYVFSAGPVDDAYVRKLLERLGVVVF
ncbi:TetR/AcrR family transcriptional regulator [Phytomonospora endophytica]|uniref:AcrR family transcriptional regulator n=1 Tax=Phytomonospora endophytica TaxID=714109 RepID=A0A841FCY8_9ACTN|nr:TetR/AcrR family transcriptional regulator [Phytomonospora endophytica]MBB6034136.1 AcrR family transcriptional regulator [Phytomonospora endophytica]GIG66528.1 TetR family transcriptional regulator [Phytomonospora endophytica]